MNSLKIEKQYKEDGTPKKDAIPIIIKNDYRRRRGWSQIRANNGQIRDKK